MVDNYDIMTDDDFEKALNLLETNDYNEVSDLLKVMNENRIITWEDAEKIMCDFSSKPIKSSLPQQTRPNEPENNTDVDLCIRQLLKNDSNLIEINLNNMKRTPIPQIKRIFEAMRNNTHLKKISLANMGLYDMDVAPLINVLEDNITLRSLNLETNYLSGEFFAQLLHAALKNQTLEEIKGVNQGVSFSNTAEREIINAVIENRGLLKISINLRLPEGRHKIERTTIRNLEIRRILRRQSQLEAQAANKVITAEQNDNTLVGDNLEKKNLIDIKNKQTHLNKSYSSHTKQTSLDIFENKCNNNIPKPKPSILVLFEKKRAEILNEAKKEKIELIESQKPMAPVILGSTATTEKPSVESKKILPKKLTNEQLSFNKQILLKNNSNSDNLNDDKTMPILQTSKPLKQIGKQNIVLPIKNTNLESKTAFIPEAPLGKASAMVKKFAAAEANAKEIANKSVLRRPLESTNVPMKKIIKVEKNYNLPINANNKVKQNNKTTTKSKQINQNIIQNNINENINVNVVNNNLKVKSN